MELEVIGKSKVPIGAYLHNAFSVHYSLQNKLSRDEPIQKEYLQNLAERMRKKKELFDIAYLVNLPQESVNPLETEQRAWQELSPRIGCFLDEFDRFIGTYDEAHTNGEIVRQIKAQIAKWWELIQNWNEISKSYYPKLEEYYESLSPNGIDGILFEEQKPSIEPI
ncbi:hypothetical protein HYT54_05235 [Candidatus Woesearchaeota archaeon]|nr:hypothetical protein [Candidatus Woesearchaeota archaeon]